MLSASGVTNSDNRQEKRERPCVYEHIYFSWPNCLGVCWNELTSVYHHHDMADFTDQDKMRINLEMLRCSLHPLCIFCL